MSYLRRLVAWLLSFRKRDWSVRDYPVHVRRQSSPPLWLARIHGWWLIGSGETREDAVADLQTLLDDYRQDEGALPRPGVSVPIRFAPFEFMSRNADLARDFFPPILGVDYDDCLITDRSSVWDFPGELTGNLTKEELARKVLLIYGTDVSDLAEDRNIAAILDRIAVHRRGA